MNRRVITSCNMCGHHYYDNHFKSVICKLTDIKLTDANEDTTISIPDSCQLETVENIEWKAYIAGTQAPNRVMDKDKSFHDMTYEEWIQTK